MKVLQTATLDTTTLSADEQLWAYNGLDCMVTLEVFQELEPKIEEAGFAYRMERTMQAPAFTLMERGGRVDQVTRARVLAEYERTRDALARKFLRITVGAFDVEINYRSPQQLQRLFYEILGLPPVKVYDRNTKDYRASTNREALEKLATRPSAKHLVELILAIRDCEKKIQVLSKGMSRDGRMRCSYNVAGTLTGRWSSNVNVVGEGDNLQNWTDEMRQVIIPDPGKKFGQADLAQAESRLVAYLSLPWGSEYKNACESGDLHTTVSRLIWPGLFLPTSNRSEKEIAEDPFYRHFSYRDMSKRGGHGTNYGGQAPAIAMHLKIPVELAKTFQHKYLGAFPSIPKWHNSIRLALATTRSITTPLGRRCIFPGRHWDSDTIKSAIAYNPQSTIGDLLNLGLLNIWRKYDRANIGEFFLNEGQRIPSIELINQVHDSVLFQYDPAFEHIIVPLIERELQVPIEINGALCAIDVEVKVGWNWGKWGKTNEFGLGKFPDRRDPPAPTQLLDTRLHDLHLVY